MYAGALVEQKSDAVPDNSFKNCVLLALNMLTYTINS